MDQDAQASGKRNPGRIIDALYRVNDFISRVHDLHDLLEAIMAESKAVVGADASACLLFDRETSDLYFEVALGEAGEGVKEIRLPLGTGLAGECAAQRRTLVVNDVRSDSRHFKEADQRSQYETRNLVATPMVRNDELIGVLEVLNKSEEADFTDEDVQILEFFAGQAAIAIENALLIQSTVRGERLAAMGQAVAGISHYAKNILMGIMGSSSLIDIALQGDDMQVIRQAWPVLQRSNQKLSALIQDMLTYSKERQPEFSAGNLNMVITDAVALCRERAAKLGVELALTLDPDMPVTAFEVSKISDCVLNLIGNGIDATANQPGARVEATTLFLPDGPEGALMQATVVDNGPGIAPPLQKKIFDAFYSTKGSRGTGLGLAVSRKIVEEHGGALTLESEVGRGASFALIIPARKPDLTTRIG